MPKDTLVGTLGEPKSVGPFTFGRDSTTWSAMRLSSALRLAGDDGRGLLCALIF
jgi:hypothetical protein